MPFLAVCPDCHYSQVCVLPTGIFPRIKCCRCREIYDPVGAEDTEVIPELAGATIARLVSERRATRARMRAARARRRRKARRRARKLATAGAAAAPSSAEQIAAAVLSEPFPVPAPVATADDTAPQGGSDPTTPTTEPGPVFPSTTPRPIRKRPRRRSRPETAAAVPLTAGALCLLGAALVMAQSETVGFLARPFAAISLLLGAWAIRAAIREGVQARYAVTVTGLAAAVVFAGFVFPTWMGLDRAETPDWAEGDVQIVPRAQFAADLNVWKAEWVDASKATLQQGPVRVEVADVRSGRSLGDLRPSLVVRLRLSRAPSMEPAAGSWPWAPGQRAILWDADGTRYDQISAFTGPVADPAAKEPEDSESGSSDVVLEFPLPPRPGPLRLELPAAAWGGRGQFKFAIPVPMVKW